MNQPSTNQKKHLLKKRGWIWGILIVIASIFLLNHYFQWYPWSSQEKSLRVKEPSAEQIVQRKKPSQANEHFKNKDHSPHAIEYLANERESESIDIEQPKQKLIMDYERIKYNSDPDMKNMIGKRKKELGLDKSVDMVIKSGEFIRIGEQTIPMNQILAEIEAQQKVQNPSVDSLKLKPQSSDTKKDGIESSANPVQLKQKIGKHDLKSRYESEIESHFTSIIPTTKPKKESPSYGIYLTRHGDNLWDIHFTFLREYFSYRGIIISTEADEPLGDQSSGVGRILKYAEKMVYVYNLKTKKLSKDINLLKPFEKIVIFNISKLDNVLGSLSAEQLNAIHFDGQDIILPG